MKSIQLMKQNIKLMNILMQPGNENWTWQDLIGNDGGALRASLDVWESQLFEGVFLEDVSTQGTQTYRFIRFPRSIQSFPDRFRWRSPSISPLLQSYWTNVRRTES